MGITLLVVAILFICVGFVAGYWLAWERYYDEHYRLKRVVKRIDTVSNLTGVPDRAEVERWRTELNDIATGDNRLLR